MLELDVDTECPPPFGLFARNQLFFLSEEITFANHGSFGTVARPVMELQRRLHDTTETCPEEWFRITSYPLWLESCQTVAEFVGTTAENVVLVDNATTAVNCVLKSLRFTKNDAILVSDHTYGAVEYTALAVSDITEAAVVTHVFPFPIESVEQFVGSFEAALRADPRIRIAIIDHICSVSALLLPVRRLIDICRSRNVLVLVDGAHAPGQVPIDLTYLDPDYYTGNFHKWVYAPRGCCVLYINPKHHDKINPLVTSWYWKKSLHERFYQQATRDITSWLCAKPAIQFYRWLGGMEKITAYNSSLSQWASALLASKWKTAEQQIPAEMRAPNMSVIALPSNIGYDNTAADADRLMKDIAKKHKVWVAMTCFSNRLWCRISSQVYNVRDDYERVAEAVLDMMKH